MEPPFDMQELEAPLSLFLMARQVIHGGDLKDNLFRDVIVRAFSTYEHFLGGTRRARSLGLYIPDFTYDLEPIWVERSRN